MKTKTFCFLALAVFMASLASAQTATVFRMTGSKAASILLPNAANETVLMEGQEVPEGSLVTVGSGTTLFLRTFQGAITSATEGAVFVVETVEVTADNKEKTVIELKSGDLVANLDPAKRGIHDYGVRTPKGVAAARGTNYTVSVDGVNVTVTVVGGEVSFSIPELPQPVTLTPGTASTGGAAQTLAQAVSSSPAASAAISRAMQAAASVVATLAADPNNTDGVTSATLTQVVTAAANAGGSGDNSLVALTAAAAVQADGNAASTVVAAAVAADPTTADDVVGSVVLELEKSTPGSMTSNIQDLSTVATQNGGTVDVLGTQGAVILENTGFAILPTDVEIEVPTDDIVITRNAVFTIQLSGGRLVAVSLNSVDNNVETRLVTTAEGSTTAQVGDGSSTAFTIPANVATALGQAVSAQQLTAIQTSLTTLLNGPVITVPNNTIVVSPSS